MIARSGLEHPGPDQQARIRADPEPQPWRAPESESVDVSRIGLSIPGAGFVLPLVGVAAAVGLWFVLTALAASQGSILARLAPPVTWTALNRVVLSGEIWPHLFASLRRIAIGLGLAMAAGVPIGLAVGSSKPAAGLTGVVFQFLRMISPLSWAPVAIMLFGIGDAPVYFLIAIGAIWPIILNVSAGVHALDPRWLTLSRSLGATTSESFLSIVWPGIRAHLLTGFRLAVGLAWIILVPAEMLGVDSGLGYFVLNTRDRLAYPELMAAILIIGACGFLIDALTRWLVDRR